MAVNKSTPAPGLRNAGTQLQEILPVIQGYENAPLVSLGDAIRPLIPYIPEVERMAQMAKELCYAPKQGLTRDESSSLLLYSMEWEPKKSFAYILNTTLQDAGREVSRPWFLYIRLIMSALAKLPYESSHLTVYRGLKMDLSAQLKKGNKIVWSAFSSCTMSLDALRNERFLGNNGTRTLFIIDCYSGKKIQNHTVYPDEEEVLLLPGSQFQVMGYINEGNGLLVVQLKEIEPRYTMTSQVQSLTNNSHNITLRAPPPQQQQQENISSRSVQTSMASIPLERTRPTISLPAHRPLVAVARTMLPPIHSSSNLAQGATELSTKAVSQLVTLPPKLLQQPSVKPTEQAQLKVKSNRPLTAKPWYDAKKSLEQKPAFRIDPTCSNLDLRDQLIDEQGAKDIASDLKHNQKLRILSLWYNHINDRGAQYLANALEHNTALTTLHLSYNSIGPQGAKHIANALRKNTTLITLYLSYNQIGDQGAQYLADALRDNSSLKTLNLYSNQIGSSGAKALANALQANQKLATLNLADNQIDDEGVQHIAHALRSNTTLKTLNLNNNKINNDGARHLVMTLKSYKTLTNLYICNKRFNNETRKLFEELKTNNPGLKIFFR